MASESVASSSSEFRRYRRFVSWFVLAFVSLVGIFYIATFIDLADKLFRGSTTTAMLLRFFYFQTPQYVYYIVPLAALLATLVTVGARMTKVPASAPASKCRTIAGTATLSMVELRPTKKPVSDGTRKRQTDEELRWPRDDRNGLMSVGQ